MNTHDMDALALSGALERKEISAKEVMQETLARIAATNGTVNAVVSLRDPDDLLAEAQATDNAPRSGWLHGIPTAVKDLANVRGLPTSMGSPLFAGQIAAQDDLVVARIRQAGAMFVGKTNTPEFGLGSHTFNPVHGATCNPYDTALSAGGSSGGAAAALACGMVSVADGSDMMGSLRNPAAWNNVYGMRPTWGTVPSEPKGEIFFNQLATSGPMARTPMDLAAFLDTMTGEDPRQPHGMSPAASLPHMQQAGGAMRLGWLGDWDGALPMEAGLIDISTTALNQMETLGHAVTPIKAPFDADLIWQSWLHLRHFAMLSGLHPLYQNADMRGGLKATAVWEIESGLKLTALDVARASAIRSDWFTRTCALFEQVDVLVLPSTQVWPFAVETEHPTEIAGVAMDTYHRWMQVVVPAGLLGLPVVNVPIGFGENGLPAGLQLIGPRGSDTRLLQLAQHWHQATAWPQKRPPVI